MFGDYQPYPDLFRPTVALHMRPVLFTPSVFIISFCQLGEARNLTRFSGSAYHDSP